MEYYNVSIRTSGEVLGLIIREIEDIYSLIFFMCTKLRLFLTFSIDYSFF